MDITIAGEVYDTIKTGRAQANQVILVTKWIAKHGMRAFRSLNIDQAQNLTGTELIFKLVEELDADALIDLFIALVGCSKEVAEVHFDIATLIDVAVDVYQNQPSLRKIVDRFFLSANSSDSTQELSTVSEVPTDGQMT